jgi:hypothetical protein
MKLEADNWLKGEERGTTKYNSPGGSAFGDWFPQRFRVRLKKNAVPFGFSALSCPVLFFSPVLFWVSFSKRFGFLREGGPRQELSFWLRLDKGKKPTKLRKASRGAVRDGTQRGMFTPLTYFPMLLGTPFFLFVIPVLPSTNWTLIAG